MVCNLPVIAASIFRLKESAYDRPKASGDRVSTLKFSNATRKNSHTAATDLTYTLDELNLTKTSSTIGPYKSFTLDNNTGYLDSRTLG